MGDGAVGSILHGGGVVGTTPFVLQAGIEQADRQLDAQLGVTKAFYHGLG